LASCQWGCDQGCPTFGAHLRAKSIGYNGCFPTRSNGFGRGDATGQKKWDAELQAYRDARAQGIQPSGTTRKSVERAVRMSDKAGKAYDAGTGTFG
jgi:hypothetical protein